MKCPKCNSTHLRKEQWRDVVSDGYGLAGDSIYSDTGDWVCRECGFIGSKKSFEDKKTN